LATIILKKLIGIVTTPATLSDTSRKVSSSSLQIPGGLLRRSNSDGAGSNQHCCHQDDATAAKKVTFSQVIAAHYHSNQSELRLFCLSSGGYFFSLSFFFLF